MAKPNLCRFLGSSSRGFPILAKVDAFLFLDATTKKKAPKARRSDTIRSGHIAGLGLGFQGLASRLRARPR